VIRLDARWGLTALATLLLAAAPYAATRSAPARVTQEPDDDERAYELAQSERIFRENCLMCHSVEMAASQRMTAAQWLTEVDKMIGWGAPVPPEEKDRLVAYLAETYPSDKPPTPPATMSPDAIRALNNPPDVTPVHADADSGAKLYEVHCASCHGPQGRGGDLGTNLVEIPILLRPDEFAGVLKEGRRRMPGFDAALKPGQPDEILAWLRGLRYEATKP
jgi:mono/diheme cytochrome c family protein